MHITDEAKKRIVAYIKAHDLINYYLRVHATEKKGKLSYQLFWDDQIANDDIVQKEDGFTICTSVASSPLLNSTLVFVLEEEGVEGLFIMENQLDCASCMIDCF
ncbi:hypothetical protein [Amphibacillus cookii]|uniref:hypothetical protein n=1 Tax=Amphibacillus cookii TaxID=767787 RepID=UPI00195CE27F|nr:hypothetical protein [Amphibacillus cookii]MBM7541897.1 Fe-S cluster assembly iron-binding protein IscA [Amphibacillus cookii]